MNRIIPKTGAAIVSITVFLFAACLIIDFPFGSYLVCLFLPIGYIMMIAGFQNECSCFFMPMTGMFTNMSDGEAGNGGTIALVFLVCLFPFDRDIGVQTFQ